MNTDGGAQSPYRFTSCIALLAIGLIVGVVCSGLINMIAFRKADVSCPRDSPKEYLRVYHPRGFSVVRPFNWHSEIRSVQRGDTIDKIILMSDVPSGERTRGVIWETTRLSDRPSVDKGFVQTTFQGSDAWKRIQLRSGAPPDTTSRTKLSLAFSRHDAWYMITCSGELKEAELSDCMQHFFDTFVADGIDKAN